MYISIELILKLIFLLLINPDKYIFLPTPPTCVYIVLLFHFLHVLLKGDI